MRAEEISVTVISDVRLPNQAIRELAVWLALEAGKHVHLGENGRVYCLDVGCPFGGPW